MEHWCRVLGLSPAPPVEPGRRSFYWGGTCVINTASPHLDNDLVHELHHCRDDRRFPLEHLWGLRGALGLAAMASAAVLWFGHPALGGILLAGCTGGRSLLDLAVEGRAEATARRLAPDPTRSPVLRRFLGFHLGLLGLSGLLVALLWVPESRATIIGIALLGLLMLVLTLLSDRLLR